ncbi:ParA family protein [Carnobacterium maltaromaticum]|uniref:ParA family protein n=1 Tax=Carnobacterium maltaromaticum TaxID=2751 RepID=UPI000705127F|nr:ParA family protein [Carnobacterium maltaromaticum]AOA04052.1 cobyrinic acid a,c-diamide synthase [Carnobacterium maltaromaticum]KRN87248.1 cobQ CobB MinD ParA nucleotide binding domain protein [Carnobacterium maltaromaticum]MBC9810405.1 AAA family ATPase [Carnobacterium maltaromaticum]GED49938.1 cobyrinic acid a,c-diamide synthase [Carnobacterium maltaromaticum]
MKKAKVYVIGNFKGGVGKSTAAQMLGFESAVNKGLKTLIIDLDMQGNTSDVMNLTHMNFSEEEGGGNGEPLIYNKTVTDVLISDTPVNEGIYQIVNNLDILPANMSFELYDSWIKEQFPESIDQFKYMKDKFSPLMETYDVIYLDVPPSISVYSKSAMYMADWAIVILQTQVKSMRNAMQYLEYMEFFTEEFDTNLRVAGIIPFMLESGDAVDQEMYELAKELYDEHLLKNVVLKNARLKRYDGSGITMEKTIAGKLKQWDRRSHELFINILDELNEHETWYNNK